MQNDNKLNLNVLLNFDVLASLAMLVGVLVDFNNNISGHFAGFDLSAGRPRYAYFMLAITCSAILILFINISRDNNGGSFIWLPACYVLSAFISTVLSGRFPLANIPFRFIELFYWVAVMALSYYAVLTLNTPKFHVALVVLAVPVLAYKFYVVRGAESATSDMLLLNPVFYISFLTPVVLLLSSKVLKTGLLLLIFVVIILSYKRMAILAYGTSILVYFYCLSKTRSNAARSGTIIIILGAVMFAGILVFSFKFLSGAFGLDWSARMSDIVEGGGGGRIGIWWSVFSAWLSQPVYWLIGHGRGALSSSSLGFAHNDILEILYDFGLMGLAFYFLFAVKMIRIFFEMKQFGYRHFGAFAASLVWSFWGGMTDVFINYPYHFLGITLFWGIAVADFEIAKSQAEMLEAEESLYIDQDGQEDVSEPPYV